MRLRVVLVMMLCAAACSSGDGREMASPDAVAPLTPPTTTIDTMMGDTPPTTTIDTMMGDASSQTGGPATVPTISDRLPAEPVGFERVAATITRASGELCELCLWLAATPEQRSRGLMGVTDFGTGDGMIFRYPIATSTSFWMRDTLMPLSIAFFDDAGAYMDAFDMEPCVVEACPRFATPREFFDAIEFPQGTPAELGIGVGSVLEVSDLPCGS